MKKVTCFLLALVMILVLAACGGNSKESGSEGLEYAYNGDGTYSLAEAGTCTDTHVVIPASYKDYPVTIIGHHAFRGRGGVTSIIIPDSITTIQYSAFEACQALADLVIPDSVTSIEAYAFEWCTSLTSIVIPEGVTAIESFTFYKCSSLTDITIPDSVATIGEYAFKECSSLTSITIPSNVTSIGDYAFYGCGLTEIRFGGTKAQWETFGEGIGLSSCYTVYCSDGEIVK